MAASCAPRLSGPARTRCPYWCAIDQALQSLQSTCRMCLCLTEGTDSTPPGKCRLSVVCVWGARVGIVYWRRSRRLCVRRLASLQRRVSLSRLVRYRAQGCVLRGVAPASGALLPCVRSSHRHEDLTHAGCVGCQVRWTQWLWACPFRRSTPRARAELPAYGPLLTYRWRVMRPREMWYGRGTGGSISCITSGRLPEIQRSTR